MEKGTQLVQLRRLSNDCREQAMRLLYRRVFELSHEHRLPYDRISIRNQRSLWGSCTSEGTINLNLNLTQLSDEMIDYVILHELTHVRIRNHGKKFWDRLSVYCPNARRLDRLLRQVTIVD